MGGWRYENRLRELRLFTDSAHYAGIPGGQEQRLTARLLSDAPPQNQRQRAQADITREFYFFFFLTAKATEHWSRLPGDLHPSAQSEPTQPLPILLRAGLWSGQPPPELPSSLSKSLSP